MKPALRTCIEKSMPHSRQLDVPNEHGEPELRRLPRLKYARERCHYEYSGNLENPCVDQWTSLPVLQPWNMHGATCHSVPIESIHRS